MIGLEYKQSKAPSKKVRNVTDEIDMRIDKDIYDGSGENMVIEEDNNHSYQKEEHNLQTDAEDDGLVNIWNGVIVVLECPKVSAFDFLYIRLRVFM